MDLIKTQNTEKCTNCYKCVQQCFTKAITIKDDKVDVLIDPDLCVACGYCTKACKNDILLLNTNYADVKEILKSNKRVYLILDTIYQSDFGNITYNQMRAAFKHIGFEDVIENFTGFALHSYLSNKHFLEKNVTTIKSFCIPFNNYISKFYPDLLKYLSPIMTPESITATLTKEHFGDDIIIVYATTCFSSDIKSVDQACDYIILTSELRSLLDENNIDPFSFKDSGEKNTIYKYDNESCTERVQTIEDCVDMLDFLRKNPSYKSLITSYWCNSCFSSPVFTNKLNTYERQQLYQTYKVNNYNIIQLNDDNVSIFGDLNRFFIEHKPHPVEEETFTESEISDALKSFGRMSENDHFDCGACGYQTCRENAIAILQGKSTTKQCIPYISKIFSDSMDSLNKAYKELDDAFALTIPNSRLEIKLKHTKEYQDIYIKETGKIKIVGAIEDGSYRHVVNALKVAADLHSKGVMSVIGFDKDILVKAIIFHDIGKSQPSLRIGDEVEASLIFENGKLHAERSAELALANYAHEGINKDIYTLIKYHHHNEKELPVDFPTHLLPMYRLFRIIDGISAGLTRRGNKISFELVGSVLYIKEDSQNPNYRRHYSIDLYKPEYLKKEYDFEDNLDTILYTKKYK